MPRHVAGLPAVRVLSPVARRLRLDRAVRDELARLLAIREAAETDPEPNAPVAVEDEPGTERVAGEAMAVIEASYAMTWGHNERSAA